MVIKTRKKNLIKLAIIYFIGLGVLFAIQFPMNYYSSRMDLLVYTVLFIVFYIGLYYYDKRSVKELNKALKDMKERLK